MKTKKCSCGMGKDSQMHELHCAIVEHLNPAITHTKAVCLETDKSLEYVRHVVNVHEELRKNLILMTVLFHRLANHKGFSKDCSGTLCQRNYKLIAEADGE